MKPARKQRGFLLIVAVVLIAVAATMAAVIVTLTAGSGQAGGQHLGSTQALFLAESGAERAARLVLSPTLTERVTCPNITGNANMTDISVGAGRYTVTGNTAVYPATPATLNGALNATATVIPFTSTLSAPNYGMAAAGRVMIDREVIDYSAISTSAATCGTAPCLIGAQRGRGSTTATTHATGTRLGQYQCNLASVGGVPDLVSANRAQRTLNQGVQFQEGWAVGNAGATNENLNAVHCVSASDCWAVGDNGVLVHWDGTSWTVDTSFTAPVNLNSIFCVSAGNCWAVGDPGGSVSEWPYIIRLSGGTWSTQNSNLNIDQSLNGIFCVSAGDCWAVGDPDNAANERPLILYWNGVTWARRNTASPALNLNEILNGITCTATDNCWAVGNAGTGASERPLILWWDGANWQRRNSNLNVNQDLNSAHCFNASSCMTAGNNGVSYFWDGANWSSRNTGTGENLNGVRCTAANNCFATGDNGTLLQWTGGANWSAMTSNTTENLNGIYCLATNDCFAVGDNGTILRWNGTVWSSSVTATLLRFNDTAWSNVSGSLLAPGINLDLRGISMLSYADGWLVGETGGNAVAPCLNNRARIGRWDGSSWACSASSPSNQRLNSVSMIAADDGWAVGNGGSIVSWNGATWSEQNAAQNITARELHAVYALAMNEVWITGRDENAGGKTCANGSAIVLRYTGAWLCQNTGAAVRRYRGMYMFPDGTDAGTQPDDGWIVGDRNGNDFTIYRWNNPTANQWNNQSFTDNTNRERLNSVFMLDTDGDGLGDDGWAVGQLRNNNLTVLRWNHACAGGAATGAWAICSFDPGVAAQRQNLNAVFCVHARDCWAVGDGGLILHWDSANWTVHPQSGGQPGALTTANLNGLYFIGARLQPKTAWQEIFP